ncbi:MAG: glutamate-5-semialdehyde dehydrogenase [Planctomycetota bacterium]|jgi:glutamate-5-semialdehyde dehydrogenase
MTHQSSVPHGESGQAGAPDLRALAAAAREGGRRLLRASAAERTAALQALARRLSEDAQGLIEANRLDREAAAGEDYAESLRKRLRLDEGKLQGLIEGVEALIAQPDPIGQVLRRTELDEGLELEQVQSPIGVLLIIFESRPDAVIQIGSLALRSGNAVILKGGREARHSNRALCACLRGALADVGLDPNAVVHIEAREAVHELLAFDDLIDLVIPRGSGALVRRIQSSTRIPVLGHAEGICHTYLDRAADPSMATSIVLDGKCDYPAACNATETLLVHQEFLPHLPEVGKALGDHGVALRADDAARAVLEGAEAATSADWGTEYGDLTLSVRVVPGIEAAIEHVHRHGSGHTETIVTSDREAAERFLREVDAASVFWNASTRFADGYRYGLGAEVGIATGRIHARGPVGVEGLLTTRWLLRGHGHAAGDYGPGKRAFTHRSLPIVKEDRP